MSNFEIFLLVVTWFIGAVFNSWLAGKFDSVSGHGIAIAGIIFWPLLIVLLSVMLAYEKGGE